MKHIYQVVSMDLVCYECEKFMGSLNIQCENPEDMQEKGKKLRQHLIDMIAMPVCDICNATKGVRMGKYVR